jgi:4a-hydroxytetrahydrobiopterin dehydratase
MDRDVLSPDEIDAGVAKLDAGWSATDVALTRTVEFPSFLGAVDFISALAPVAERLDHHPDLALSWRTIALSLSTHSAGGLTAYDLTLAGELDPLITQLHGHTVD